MTYWHYIDLTLGAHTFLSPATVTKIRRPSKQQRIDTIVESARKMFCSSGFEKGSIDMIARDAGIAEGTIYRYFDSKRDLLDEVLRRHYCVLFDDVQQTLPNIEGPSNRLRYLIRRILIMISEDRSMCGLRTIHARQVDNERPSLSHDQNRRMAILMTNAIKEGMADGSFRLDTSPSIVCYMIGGAVEITEYSFMKTGKPIDIDIITESIWRTIHSGMSSSDATAESLAGLVERFENVADRLDSV
ncbi:MAG: TetR/AcrR family transcriptional regulator [Pseudomonadales bacterium]